MNTKELLKDIHEVLEKHRVEIHIVESGINNFGGGVKNYMVLQDEEGETFNIGIYIDRDSHGGEDG